MATTKHEIAKNIDIETLSMVILESFSQRDWATFQGAFSVFSRKFKSELLSLSSSVGLSVTYLSLIQEKGGLEKVSVLDIERVLEWFSERAGKDKLV